MNPTTSETDATVAPEAPAFDGFWINSTLSSATLGDFGARIDEYASGVATPSRFVFPAGPISLPHPRGRFWSLLRARRSRRLFSGASLSPQDIGAVLASVATTDGANRAYPSAGATHPLEFMVLVNRCTDERLQGRVLHYSSSDHSVTPVRELPPYGDYAHLINLSTETTEPAIVVVILAVRSRTTQKYGERGGRFVLIEAGHAAQNVMLACTERKLACCAAGGLLDDSILELLGVVPGDADVLLGIAAGHPAKR